MLLSRQQLFAFLLGIGLIILILDLVRRKKLREEYSWLWMIFGATIVSMSIWDQLIVETANFIGIYEPIMVLFIFGIFFLLLICLHFCIKISKLTNQVKKLAQIIAIEKVTNNNETVSDK